MSLRRKSAFTLPLKGPDCVLNRKRLSLQLAFAQRDTHESTSESTCENTRKAGGLPNCNWTSKVLPDLNEIGRDECYPQELDLAGSLDGTNYRPSSKQS